VSFYLDASVIVPLFLADALSARASALLRTSRVPLIISDWAGLEVSNVVARQARIGALTTDEAAAALANFDLWRGRSASVAEISALDISIANQFVRRFNLNLRGLDAVHLAMTQRLGATLWTFDARMAAAATALGLSAAS
jgi:predicted nucleic acid-binding protein